MEPGRILAVENNIITVKAGDGAVDFIERKIEIMNIYKNEIGSHPFPRSERNIRALATFRGATAGCEYAESFMILKEII